MTIKTLILAAAAATSLTTTAHAENYFGFGERLESSSTLELGTVRAGAAGVVEIYDYRNNSLGQLLGSKDVRAGANPDVHVTVGNPPRFDVVAVLRIDGEIVAQRDFHIDRM